MAAFYSLKRLIWYKVGSSLSMNKLFASFLLLLTALLVACGDSMDSDLARLEIYVTKDGAVPDAYTLKVYRGETLVKTHAFDGLSEQSNVTVIENTFPGPYYLEAESGELLVRDTVALYRFSRKVVQVELTQK